MRAIFPCFCACRRGDGLPDAGLGKRTCFIVPITHNDRKCFAEMEKMMINEESRNSDIMAMYQKSENILSDKIGRAHV